MVTQTRLVARWLQSNTALFRDNVIVPFVAEMDEDAVRQWVSRAERDDASYEQLRDATLVDFATEEDILLFMRLMGERNLSVNVSLRGQDYIANNAYTA